MVVKGYRSPKRRHDEIRGYEEIRLYHMHFTIPYLAQITEAYNYWAAVYIQFYLPLNPTY